MRDESGGTRIPEWAWIGLLVVLLFDVWWRGHTFGPSVSERLNGARLWPVVTGETEPLDCDESAYGYMGRRMAEGAVLYRDLAENKPPGGYWLYQLAITLGRADEWTVRLLPIPIVLLTLALVWWTGWRIAGPLAACLAALLYTLLSTDPYLYGNGAQLELPMNLCGVASLAAMVVGLRRPGWVWPFVAGACVAAGTLIRQVAAIPLLIYAAALLLGDGPTADEGSELGAGSRRGWRSRWLALGALLGGFVLVGGLAVAVIVSQGAGPAMVENVIVGGAALVTDTPLPEHAPPFYIRWLTGNSDPRTGALPWPFGKTDYLVWWGRGSWPLWLAGSGAMFPLLRRGDRARRLVVAWTIGACAQVILPRQYWAHYYLLPTPGIALAVAIVASDAGSWLRAKPRAGPRLAWAYRAGAIALLAAAAIGTTVIQVRDYLLVAPEQLTARYKGGAQWIRLRQIGRELERKASALSNPALFVWGWQSPLYFYSGLDCPSRHFFVNDLMKTQATREHPLVGRWIREILDALDRSSPSLIFTGYPPFPALEQRLRARYQVSRVVPDAPVLWVLQTDARAFALEGRKLRMVPAIRHEAEPRPANPPPTPRTQAVPSPADGPRATEGSASPIQDR